MLCVVLLLPFQLALSGDAADLPGNYHRLSQRVRCSGEPSGDKMFAALADEGVKTIVSVDGGVPDAKSAERHGLKYIHLPMGYGGVPGATVAALDKVLRDHEGPVLIHCHHGQHRGPAAAVIAAMIEGSMTREEALQTLERIGTSPEYAGLWRDVRNFAGVPNDVTVPPLQAAVEVEPFVADMVAIDHAFDALVGISVKREVKEANDPPPGKAGAGEQAALIVEGFREALRHMPKGVENRSKFEERLQTSLELSERLLVAAGAHNAGALKTPLAKLKDDCRACHRKFRD